MFSLALTVGCAYVFITGSRLMGVIDSHLYDTWIRARAGVSSSSKIVVAAVDAKSIDREGRWGWPRAKFGQLIRALNKAGVRVIVFDMFCPESDVGDNDAEFAKAIKESSATVVLGSYFHFNPQEVAHVPTNSIPLREKTIIRERYSVMGHPRSGSGWNFLPEAILPESNVPDISNSGCRVGYINTTGASDGSVRSIPGVISYNGNCYPPLSVVSVASYMNTSNLFLRCNEFGVRNIAFGNMTIPVGSWGQIHVNYRHDADSFAKVSATDILAGNVDPTLLRDKIVIVGATAVGLGDVCVTPIQAGLPGLFVHAFVIESILAGDYLCIPSWDNGLTLVSIVFTGLITGLFFSKFRVLPAIGSVLLLNGAYFWACRTIFMRDGVFVSPAYPLLTAWVILVVVGGLSAQMTAKVQVKQ